MNISNKVIRQQASYNKARFIQLGKRFGYYPKFVGLIAIFNN